MRESERDIKKQVRKIYVLMFIAVLLCSCSPRLESGIVVKKEYTPARSGITYTYNGKQMIPVPQYYPERYEVVIENEVDGKIVHNTCYVPPTTYERLKVGDWYNAREQ